MFLSFEQVPSYQKQLRNSQAQSKAKKKIIIKKVRILIQLSFI